MSRELAVGNVDCFVEPQSSTPRRLTYSSPTRVVCSETSGTQSRFGHRVAKCHGVSQIDLSKTKSFSVLSHFLLVDNDHLVGSLN